MSGNFIF